MTKINPEEVTKCKELQRPTEFKVPQDGRRSHLQGTSDCRGHRIVTAEVTESPNREQLFVILGGIMGRDKRRPTTTATESELPPPAPPLTP